MAPFDHTGTLIVMANPDSHELVCASSTAASHRCGAIFSGSRFCTVNSTVRLTVQYRTQFRGASNFFSRWGSRDTHETDTQTCLPGTCVVLCDVGSGKK